jgi:hypothetical protein
MDGADYYVNVDRDTRGGVVLILCMAQREAFCFKGVGCLLGGFLYICRPGWCPSYFFDSILDSRDRVQYSLRRLLVMYVCESDLLLFERGCAACVQSMECDCNT